MGEVVASTRVLAAIGWKYFQKPMFKPPIALRNKTCNDVFSM
jgi:hypothetical protein